MNRFGLQKAIKNTSRIIFPGVLAVAVLWTAAAQGVLSTETAAPVLGSSQVSLGMPITVSAAVVDKKGDKVTRGTVNFCLESAVRRDLLKEPCGPFPLAAAQLTKSGIAVSAIRLPIGAVKVVAVFTGTKTLQGSISPSTLATVTGLDPTTTTLAYSGPTTDLTLTASVSAPSAFIPGYLSVRDLTSKQPLFSFPGPVTTNYSFRSLGGNVPLNKAYQQTALAVDLNNDGYLDAVLLNETDTAGSLSAVDFYFNEGGRSLTRAKQGPTVNNYNGYTAMGEGDLNADDVADLVLYDMDDNRIDIYYGNGNGSFPAKPSAELSLGTPPLSSVIYTADFNEDGTIDFAFDDGGQFVVIPNNGDGTFGQPILSSDGSTQGDGGENGKLLITSKDGHTDVVMPGDYDEVFLLKGHGDGTFTSTRYDVSGDYDLSVAVLDLNEDGYDDLMLGSTPIYSADNPMPGGYPTIFISDGNGNLVSSSAPVLPYPAVNLLALPYGVLATDNGGHFSLLQPDSGGAYPLSNFSISPHPPGQQDGANLPMIAAGDFKASGLSGFLLDTGQEDGGFSGYSGLQAYSASAISVMTIQQSGFTFPTPQTLLGLYHPGGNAAFISSDSQQVTVPGTN